MCFLVKILLKKQIINLLTKIHKCYPSYFNENDLKTEIILICNYIDKKLQINLSYKNDKIVNDRKNNNEKIINKKLNNNKIDNKNKSITNKNKCKIKSTNKLNNGVKIEIPKFNPTCCYARVFDINYLEWKDEKNQIHFGRQCKRKKSNNSNYCTHHLNNNPHQDFNKLPDLRIKDHFRQYKNYMKKNKKKFIVDT